MNQHTIQSLQMSNVFYRFLANKVRVLATLTTSYRDAYAAGDRARTDSALAAGITGLENLGTRFSQLRDHLRIAVAQRNRSPDELASIDESAQSLTAFAAALAKARTTIAQGQPLPPPKQLGLEPAP